MRDSPLAAPANAPPARVVAESAAGRLVLEPNAEGSWASAGVAVSLRTESRGVAVCVASPDRPLSHVRLHWPGLPPERCRYLADHWERGYGDLEWRTLVPHRSMPWYFLSHDPDAGAIGTGVMTGASAIASWTVSDAGVSLHLDLRSGGAPVRLGKRELVAAAIRSVAGDDPYDTACALCAALHPAGPRRTPKPIYGSNNWYYAYGRSSHDELLADADLVSQLCSNSDNRPFMVMDDGWQVSHFAGAGHVPFNGGPWTHGNAAFPDMPGLARGIRDRGARPGLWFRPLYTVEAVPSDQLLPGGRTRDLRESFPYPIMDPAHPAVLERIAGDVRRFVGWGYELLKHDFTTFDICGEWGINMRHRMVSHSAALGDGSHTTAEVIVDLYRTIRTAADEAGGAVILACNAIGHLAAGLAEVSRTGDDTSGREWERTRKMGINTLAYRMPQHDRFFAADADCLGLTGAVDWELDRRWLELLSRSGTPLFVSARPSAVGPDQRKALSAAFDRASRPQPAARPLDWLETTCPRRWQFGADTVEFNWSTPMTPFD